jgi:hypothetical protein
MACRMTVLMVCLIQGVIRRLGDLAYLGAKEIWLLKSMHEFVISRVDRWDLGLVTRCVNKGSMYRKYVQIQPQSDG